MATSQSQAGKLERHRALSLALSSTLLFLAMPSATAMSWPTDGLIQSRSSGKTRAFSARAFVRFRLQGSNGYRILVWGSSKGVELVAARRHEAASYFDWEGMANHNAISARFGRAGRIDLHFHPAKKIFLNKKTERCDVHGEPFYYGYFTGVFLFKGEASYTSVRRRKIHGLAGGPLALKCAASQRKAMPRAPSGMKSDVGPKLEANSLGSTRFLVFRKFIVGGNAMSSARSQEERGVPLNLATLPRSGVPYLAESFEVRPRLMILRLLVAKGPVEGFSIRADGKEAMVRPPKPFAGKAEYRACAYPFEWRGTLKVSLPGLPNLALVGREFFVVLNPHKKCTASDAAAFEAGSAASTLP